VTVVRIQPLSARLVELLRGAHDDGELELSVMHDPPALVLLRADSRELSETEQLEVRAILAADAAEPIE
jgi:hypothetical protein